MTPEQEIQWREEFEKLINYRGCIRFCNGVYTDNRLHQKWIGFKTAKKKAQEEISQLKEEFEKLHSFCLNYQIYIHDILHSVNVFKSFHDLRKGAHAYAVSMDKDPKWDYQDIENTDYFNGLKSYVVQLKEQIASAKEIKQYPTALTYISELKEELRRERDTVDFYASSESWNHSGYTTYAERHFAKISEKMKIDYDDAENYPVSIIGGRLARQTQQQRRIEL